jgi:hypothetical protein
MVITQFLFDNILVIAQLQLIAWKIFPNIKGSKRGYIEDV